MSDDDFEAYLGLFDSEALVVRFAFTRAAHQAAAENWVAQQVQGDDLSTYVHELTHFLQSTTTSYGLFLYYCRQVQYADTVEVVRALLEAEAPIKLPLLRHAPLNLKGEPGSTVRGGLARWLNTELMISSFAQDDQNYLEYRSRFIDGPFEIVPARLNLFRMQGAITNRIETENAGRARRGWPAWDNGIFDVAAINAEGNEDDYWLGDSFARDLDRATLMVDFFGNPWGAESILESAATAAEWANSGRSLADLQAYVANKEEPELAIYKTCLGEGLKAIEADSLEQFVFTFLTLCELALSPPILPQQARIRKLGMDSNELFPPHRFRMLLGAAGHVRPLNGLPDVARYNLEMCERLGWVQPIEMIRVALDGPQHIADPRAQRYIWAQSERASRQHAFTNLLLRDLDQSAIGDQFRARYAIPVMQYADKTLYMGDKDALWWFSMQAVTTAALRQIIIGKSFVVTCPYRGTEAEGEALTEGLRRTLAELFGQEFPMARVVMPK